MDGMTTIDPPKVSVALGLQLQVQVADGATVMFQTHVDREDASERNRTIDVVHAAAERFFFRYRITALQGMVSDFESSIETEHAQRRRDEENFLADQARRAVEKDALLTESRDSWVASNKRGEPKPLGRVATQIARLDQEIEKANETEADHKATYDTNIAKLTRGRDKALAEIAGLRAKLDGADS